MSDRTENLGKIIFRAGVIVEGFLYYSDWNSNGLFKMNLSDYRTEILDVFNSDIISCLHEFAFLNNEEIWFVPNDKNEKIAIYNIKNKDFQYICIPDSNNICKHRPFMNYCIEKEYVWLLPASYDAILKINMETRVVERCEILDEEEQLRINRNRFVFSSSYESDGKIYMCPWGSNYILVWDIKGENVNKIPIEIPSYIYKNIFVNKDNVFLFPQTFDKEIIKYDLKKGLVSKMLIDKQQKDVFYDAMISDDDNVIFVPSQRNSIFSLNLDTWEIDNIKICFDIQDLVWLETRKIGEITFVIPYEDDSRMLYYKDGELNIFGCRHFKDEEIRHLLIKMGL